VPERRLLLLLLGITNLAFLALDARTAWPSPLLVIAGRIALTVVFVAAALLAREGNGARVVQETVRALALGTALSFGAIVKGTGGTSGPYFAFFSVIPIVFTMVVPDDVPAAVIISVLSALIGVLSLRGGDHPLTYSAFWCVAYASSGAYAVAGALLHCRFRWREAEAQQGRVARERERLERELLRQRLEFIGSQVNDILLLVTPDGAILQANDRAAEAYGYRGEELVRLSIRDLRAPETLGEVTEQIRVSLAQKKHRFQTIHRRRDGSTFPVDVSVRPLDLGGRSVLQSIIRDVSEEHRARAAAEYQSMLLENLHDVVVGLGPDLNVTAWNHAAERVLGFKREEAMGRPGREVASLVSAEGLAFEEVFAKAASEGRVRSDIKCRTRNGEFVPMESTVVALRGSEGALLGYVAVGRDISVRRRAQEALQASQEKLRRILDTADEGIWVVDVQGVTEFANGRAAEIFGLTVSEMLGRPFFELVPEDLRSIARADLESLARGEKTKRAFKLRRSDGSEIHLVHSRSILRGPGGEVAGSVSVFTDVTAQRRALEELQQAQKLEAIGRLAAGIAHEINTPIQFIGDNTHFLADAFADAAGLLQRYRAVLARGRAAEAEEDLERAAQEIEIDEVLREAPRTIARTLEGVRRVATIVRAMKEFAHPEQGEMVATDLNRAIRATLEVARNEYKYVADIETDLAELPLVMCHAGDINQVFLNVIVNAAHAIETVVKKGGGRGVLRVITRCEANEVTVSIADTGCGIPEQIHDKIFEPFFTTKEVGRGTGQGLAIARSIVAKHGGVMSFTSNVGQGTTFLIRLPLAHSAKREAA